MEIIIIEDDRIIRERIGKILLENGYGVTKEGNGGEALAKIRQCKHDFIILDINLPGMNGLDLCRIIRKNPDKYGNPFIIMLTSKGGSEDIISGLEIGADDYMKKPFDDGELLARIKVLSRRNIAKFKKVYIYNDIILNDNERSVKDGEDIVEVTSKEYELLKYFLINRGIALSREKIYESVWEMPYFESNRTVDVYIHKIKRKFKDIEKNLVLVRGSGYKLI